MRNILLACLLASLACACSADRSPRRSGEEEAITSAVTVGPAGFTLRLPDTATLKIPAGALSAATGIGFKNNPPTEGLPPLPASMEAVSDIYELTPHGLNFEKSVSLTLPHRAMTEKGLFLLSLADPDDDAWDIVTAPVNIGPDSVDLKLSHFSYYVVVRYRMGDAGMDATLPDGAMVDPDCGNGQLDPGEVCDDGTNDGGYNSCAPDCMAIGPRCGDGVTDDDFGEVCDDGMNDDSYGGCAPDCMGLGPYCGDGTVDPSGNEMCDDGTNDGGYGSCAVDCLSSGPVCGDGQVDTDHGEFCDPPESCTVMDACTSPDACVVPAYAGSPDSCTASCDLTTVIDQCIDGDGCCPSACDSTTDDDCSASCGNGIVEASAGELCEPGVGAGCPASCDDGNPCTTDLRTGTASNCNVRCTHTTVLVGASDGCCLQGANANNDADCTPACGNGAVESGEICDSSCPLSCADPAPNNGCVGARLLGTAATCDARCERTTITALVNGDSCCPPGATYTQDRDCPVVCGDGRREGTENCDSGVNNGSYGFCNGTCTGPGPRCGDSRVNGSETCDDGINDGSDGSCSTDCLKDVVCGDGEITGTETCDDGPNNGQYGYCDSTCRGSGPSCGDGVVQKSLGETCEPGVGQGCPASCDDGDPCTLDTRTGTPGTCNVLCSHTTVQVGASDGCCLPNANANNDSDCSPFCPNQVPEAGEICDGNCPTVCIDPTPNDACSGAVLMGSAATCDAYCQQVRVTMNIDGDGCCLRGSVYSQDTDCPGCGNGVVDSGEGCDDKVNDGSEGSCTSDCSAAVKCGDGIANGHEKCDDKVNDGSEGSCTSDCSAPVKCGDGIVNGHEKCDDKVNDGSEGSCTSDCSAPVTCGDNIRNGTEACDDGKNDGSYNGCNPGCQSRAPYCGDNNPDRNDGETCDLGAQNGVYNSQCNATCDGVGPYCGDNIQNGNEFCDVGQRNGAYNGPCNSTCTDVGPFCGDGNVDIAYKEACDDKQNSGKEGSCATDCSYKVPTLADLQTTIFDKYCASCHDGKQASMNLSTEADSKASLATSAGLFDNPKCQIQPVTGGNPGASLLSLKLNFNSTLPPECGLHMPLLDQQTVGRELSASERLLVDRWIMAQP